MTRIKEILKEKGMTVNQLADMLDISRQALSKQIQGKMLVETAQRIADALNVPMWQLFASPNDIQKTSDSLVCPQCGTPLELKIKE
jgi:transcriptional regulator with XRE-family HTH domain|nr:MAG TPA: Helix-turn-helix XRE-family like protein [Caudoviricetes sp.]